jgi:hypothetical protein
MNSNLRFLFVRASRKIAKYADYKIDFAPLTMVDKGEAKLLYLEKLCKRTAHLSGDIVECGLGQGYSFARLAGVGHATGKKLWGFDSFEGFPEPVPEDNSSYAVKAGDWGNVDLDMVTSKILARVPESYFKESVVLIPGFFDASLPKAPITKIAFLHLDGDLYQSYMDCFTLLYDKVVSGGIIAFDECLSGIEYAKYPGGFTAIERFLGSKNVDLCRDMVTGKYYVIKP